MFLTTFGAWQDGFKTFLELFAPRRGRNVNVATALGPPRPRLFENVTATDPTSHYLLLCLQLGLFRTAFRCLSSASDWHLFSFSVGFAVFANLLPAADPALLLDFSTTTAYSRRRFPNFLFHE